MITYPLHLIYKGITSFRNYLFDCGILTEYRPDVYSIGVGNLKVGGTGKTPMVNYLCDLLDDTQIGVISRGYGRATKGFLEVSTTSSARSVGDEPAMMAQQHPDVKFFVSEDRVKGYMEAVHRYPEIGAFIFDDVFQHRYLEPHLRILLTEFDRPFYTDHVLPYGRLREARKGAKRADIVVVTKCPDNLSEHQEKSCREGIHRYTAPDTPVFFAKYVPQIPRNQNGEELQKAAEVVLLSGLANNAAFYEQQVRNYTVIEHFAFRDHYRVPKAKLQAIMQLGKPIITTSKDMIKLKDMLSPEEKERFYIPDIRVDMDKSFSKCIRARMGFV